MALPTSRAELKSYILRELGAPLININISDDQLDDRIDEALQTFRDYHFDGTERQYWMYQLTQDDITNRFITLDPSITGVTKIFPIGTMLLSSTTDLFSLQFQMAQSDLMNPSGQMDSFGIAPFVITKSYIELIDQIFGTTIGVNFNRHTNKLYPELTWSRVTAGEYFMIEVYRTLNPDDYPDAWQDRWLMKYATLLCKKQWGQNLKKFGNIQLLGGVVLNGKEMYDEAMEELDKMDEELIESYSLPPTGFIA